ncbi:hypothetical protein BASA61_006526 [Batrachochytrium salamandrivorans]|nr:hypothetical protein BASA60_008476 [Batrachochytrium salamandrivorans]KAH6586610.1 hypothetical protein BASA61_006526 [Batrachochytrium salamandrivorans]KAH9255015.1 hypothetical protein BASA81_006960 [Batrachochytrium salamandrivorans]
MDGPKCKQEPATNTDTTIVSTTTVNTTAVSTTAATTAATTTTSTDGTGRIVAATPMSRLAMVDADIDEGFHDDDYPEEFPFWYGGASGEQHMIHYSSTDDAVDETSAASSVASKTTPLSASAHKAVFPLDSFLQSSSTIDLRIRSNDAVGHPTSFHDHDSVLHYFVPTTQSEKLLDKYISGVIEAFLHEPSPIYTTSTHIPHDPQSAFGGLSIPDGGRPSGSDLEAYLNHLKTNVIDRSTRTASSRMIGHMTTALPFFHRPLARLLAALNQNVVKIETASTFTNLERQTLGMLHKAFYDLPDTFYQRHAYAPDYSLGVMASGGTIANITALWIARNKALAPNSSNGCRGIDKEGVVSAMGKYGYKRAVIIGSALMHYSFKKAADLLGLGEEGLCLIPTDAHFCMRVDLLKSKVDELISEGALIIAIVGIAGTTETGSIDPLFDIYSIAHRHNIHFHVDAAWGGPLIFSPEHRCKLNGISQADSITVDGHKQLYTPMGLGILLLRSPSLALYIRKTASYVIRNDSPDLGKYTLEGSRPANALYLHASLSLLGKHGLGILVTRSVTIVRQTAVRLDSHPSRCFQILHQPMSNLLLYRYVPSALRDAIADGSYISTKDDEAWISEATRRIQIRQASCVSVGAVHPHSLTSPNPTGGIDPPAPFGQQQQPLPGFVSRTRVWFRGHHVDALRVVVANPLTTWDDIEGVISDQLHIGAEIEAEMQREQMVKRLQSWISTPCSSVSDTMLSEPEAAKATLSFVSATDLHNGSHGDPGWWPGWPFDL